MPITASCHCGATQLALPDHPTKASRCNCTFCQRTGAVWAYYDIGQIEILRCDDQRDYSSDFKLGAHHFCGKCGMHTWGESIDWSSVYEDDGRPKQGDGEAAPKMTKCQVNLNLVDDLDWSRIEIEQLDGRNAW